MEDLMGGPEEQVQRRKGRSLPSVSGDKHGGQLG